MTRHRRCQNPTLAVGLCQRGHARLEPRPPELLPGHRGNQLPLEADRDPLRIRAVRCRLQAKVEDLPPPVGVESLSQAPREVLLTSPPEVQELEMVPTGSRLLLERPGVKSPNPRGLPFQSPRLRSGEGRWAKYMARWSENSHPSLTSFRGPCGPTILELMHQLLICGPARPSVWWQNTTWPV